MIFAVPGRTLRILILHSPYLTGDASGENRVVEQEARLLEAAGHSVWTFLPERRASRRLGGGREALSAVWSGDAVRRVRGLIARDSPDVVHCHNLFPALSPAVLRAADDAGAAVVMTLHNYRLLCLPATFLRDGRVCELCLGRQPWRGVVHRCYRGSLGGSAALGTSLSVLARSEASTGCGAISPRATSSGRSTSRPASRPSGSKSSRTSSRKHCGAAGPATPFSTPAGSRPRRTSPR